MAVEQQMEMAFMEDRPTVDPVSGNEVPPGSLPEEVRDDIDARLSEGEYVVPADVVRYYGVKFFEDLRAEAKSGLGEMEADGRIGGEPVDMDMLDMDDEDDMDPDSIPTIVDDGTEDNSEGMYRGGMVGIGMGGYTSPPTQNQGLVDQVQTQAMQSPATMQDLSSMTINNNTTMANTAPQDMMSENRDKADEVRRFARGGMAVDSVDTQTQSAFDPYNYPLGFSLSGSTGARETKPYYNPETGTTTLIPHDLLTGMPLYPPPPGFVQGTPADTEMPEDTEAPDIPQLKSDDDDDDPAVDQDYYSRIMDYGKFDPETATEQQYRQEIEGATGSGSLIAGGIGSVALGPIAGYGISKFIDSQNKKKLQQLLKSAEARALDAKETEDLDAMKTYTQLSNEIDAILKNKETETPFSKTILGDLLGIGENDKVGLTEESKNRLSGVVDSFKKLSSKGNKYDNMYRDDKGNVNVSSDTAKADWQKSIGAVAAAQKSGDPAAWHKAVQAQSAASKAFTEAKQKETGRTGFFGLSKKEDDDKDDDKE